MTTIFGPHSRAVATRFIRLDTARCRACWTCVDLCHKHVFGKVDFLGHRHAVISQSEQCTGCLKCVQRCDTMALQQILTKKEDSTMAPIVAQKPFNKRAFISVAMCVSGLALPVSGIMNHSLQFEPWSIARHLWMSIHNMSALLFTIFLLWHIGLNGRALGRHLRAMSGALFSKEVTFGVLLVIGVVGVFSLHSLLAR